MKRAALLLVSLCLILTCGCSGYREIDSEYLISAIAFEKEGKSFHVYAEVRSISTQDKEPESKLFDADGDTPYEAVNNMALLLPKKAVFDHCGTAIIDEKITGKDFKSVIKYLYDTRNLNLGIYLFAAKDVKKILSCDPQAISVGYDIMSIQDNMEKTSGVKFKNKYYETVSRTMANGGFCLPVVSVNDDRPSISGQIIYDSYKPAVTLDESQTSIYNMLLCGSTGGEISVDGKRCRTNKITAKVIKEKYTLSVKIYCCFRHGEDELSDEIEDETIRLMEKLKNTSAMRLFGIRKFSDISEVEVSVIGK